MNSPLIESGYYDIPEGLTQDVTDTLTRRCIRLKGEQCDLRQDLEEPGCVHCQKGSLALDTLPLEGKRVVEHRYAPVPPSSEEDFAIGDMARDALRAGHSVMPWISTDVEKMKKVPMSRIELFGVWSRWNVVSGHSDPKVTFDPKL